MPDRHCVALGVSQQELAQKIHEKIVRQLAVELLKKQLAEKVNPEQMESSLSTAVLVENWLAGNNENYLVRIALQYPIIGRFDCDGMTALR